MQKLNLYTQKDTYKLLQILNISTISIHVEHRTEDVQVQFLLSKINVKRNNLVPANVLVAWGKETVSSARKADAVLLCKSVKEFPSNLIYYP